MIDTDNLRTASLYINNQLLSRGLLRDGHDIDFASPGGRKGDGASLALTMGRIIGVVNDLILRRDRDAEHRESLSTTLRALRAESLRQTSTIAQLQEVLDAAKRQCALHEAAESNLRAQLKTSEGMVKKLQEDAVRAKKLVADTRTTCANDVRKRDAQIDKLKKAVADVGKIRGEKRNPAITTISVTGKFSGLDEAENAAANPNDSSYDLRQETNGFLAELAKSLSEENETLLGLVRKTANTLQEISGTDKEEMGSGSANKGSKHAVVLPNNCVEMETDIDDAVSHLRTILTNPSFVPLEEVVIREDEIKRLRSGWEKMEIRWREAVKLIDSWRKRMVADGRSVNMEELSLSLRLSPVRVANIPETDQGGTFGLPTLEEEQEPEDSILGPSGDREGSLHLVPAPKFDHLPEIEEANESDTSSIFDDEVRMDDLDDEEPNVETLQQTVGFEESTTIPPPPKITPLEHGKLVKEQSKPGRKRPGDFASIAEAEEPTEAKSQDKGRRQRAESPPKRVKHDTVQPSKPAAPPAPGTGQRAAIAQAKNARAPNRPLSSAATSKPDPRSGRRTPVQTIATKESTLAKDRPEVGWPGARPVSRPIPSRPTSKSQITETEAKQPVQEDLIMNTLRPGSAEDETAAPKSDVAPRPAPLPSTGVSAPVEGASPRKPFAPNANSRLPMPSAANQPAQSPLTKAAIAAKLAATEREADAARVRAKLKAARGGRLSMLPPPKSGVAANGVTNVGKDTKNARRMTSFVEAQSDTQAKSGDDSDELQAEEYIVAPHPPKRQQRRADRVASRRRSTLNPWELKSLIKGDVEVDHRQGAAA